LSLAKYLDEPGLPIQFLGGKVRDDVLAATGGAQRPYVSASITGTPFYLIPGDIAKNQGAQQVPGFQVDAAQALVTLASQPGEAREAERELRERGNAVKAKSVLNRLATEPNATSSRKAILYRQLGGTIVVYGGDKNEALKAYEQATELDRAEPFGWIRRASLEKQLNLYSAALESFNQLKKNEIPKWRAIGSSGRAAIFKDQGRLKESLDEFKLAEKLARDKHDVKKELGNFRGNIAVIYWLLGDLGNAEDTLLLSRSIYHHQMDLAGEMAGNSTLARVNCDRGALDDAQGYIFEAIDQHDGLVRRAQLQRDSDRMSDYDRFRIYLLRNQGCIQLAKGELEKTMFTLGEAYRIAKEYNDQEGVRVAKLDIGDAFMALYDQYRREEYLEKARLAFAESLNHGAEDQLDSLLIKAGGNAGLAAAYVARKEYAAAGRSLEISMKLFRDIGAKPGIADQHKLYGDLYAAQDDDPKKRACGEWEKARIAYTEMDMKLRSDRVSLLVREKCG
jgi:hypothetical protein